MPDSESRQGRGRHDFAACTIISKNYLALARVLARSFAAHHPGRPFFVLLVDRLEGEFDPADEPFRLIQLEDLADLIELPSFVFQYTQLECNTAVKPFLLEYLLDTYGLDDLLYLDPDILVLRHLTSLGPLIETHDIVLTPHMTEPIDDGSRPREVDILQAGTYNLGFIGVRDSENTRRFLRWWQDRLRDRCLSAHRDGYFVDQKWIDLVPSYFDRVHVLKQPGYNVAYWNLHERTVTRGDSGDYEVNGEPLYFFHFSGVQLDRLDEVSKYQNRFKLADIGEAASLFRRYRDLVLEAGHAESSKWPYAFARWDDGREIGWRARNRYLMLGPSRRRFGDPFRTGSLRSYRMWYYGLRLPPVLRQLVYLGWRALDSEASRGLRRAMARLFARGGAAEEEPQAEGDAPLPVAHGRLARHGVNVIGYLTAESGMGEVARSMARALQRVSLPFSLQNLDVGVLSRQQDQTFGANDSDFPYDVNLFCVNADQVPAVIGELHHNVLEGRRNVGYWLWEVDRFPEDYKRSLAHFDEIWTPSTHCADTFSSFSDLVVRRVPLPVDVSASAGRDRADFGIPEEDFVFLYAFDFLSIWERKNPLATIEAFRRAFSPTEPVRLVIKSSNSDFDEEGRERLRLAIGDARVSWIEQTLSRDEVCDLFRACDCYVSLHRAEGFGLTIAETMALGLPVIATAYSGNADFFNVNNGWPVRYDLVELKEDVGPYPAGAVWADPDVEHAAEQMRLVYGDPAEREQRTQRARQDIAGQLSQQAVGAILEERVRALRDGPRT